MDTGEVLNSKPAIEYKPNSLYQKYLDVQKQYPHAIVAYRLGDFYEIFGDKAIIIARELELTLTGRDCGLAECVPMIGFPYHAADSYFRQLRRRHKLVIIENEETTLLDKEPFEYEPPKPVKPPKTEPVEESNDTDDLEELREQTNHIDKDALCVLLELFNYELDVQ